jgi:hypothetical protein
LKEDIDTSIATKLILKLGYLFQRGLIPGGYKSWFINNIRHRIDWPAVEYNGGGIKTQYWINGKHITQLDGKYIYGKSKLATALLLS